MNTDIRINVSPALTFSWLKINDDHIRLETGELSLLDSVTEIPEGVSVSADDGSWERVKAGCGEDTAALISDVKGDIPLSSCMIPGHRSSLPQSSALRTMQVMRSWISWSFSWERTGAILT